MSWSGTARTSNRRIALVAVVLAIVVTAILGSPPHTASADPPITNAPSTIRNAIPVFALWKTTTPTGPDMAATAHIYTTDPAERDSLVADGWQMDVTSTGNCDGVIGYVYDRPVSGSYTDANGTTSYASVPLHRFYHPTFNSYYLQQVATPQRIVDLAGYGFQDQGAIGHAFAAATSGTFNAATVSAYTNPTSGELYHSTSATPAAGFQLSYVAAYVIPEVSAPAGPPPPPAAQLCPVSMLTQASGSVTLRYATTDLADRHQKLATGWAPDDSDVPATESGVIGHLWSRQVPGTVPVHRFFHDSFDSYFYEAITDPGRIDALAGYGFVADGPPIGYGFAEAQPTTVPLDFYFDGSQAYYATTEQGDTWAAQHGHVWQSAPVHLFTASDPAVPYYEILQPTSGPSKGVIMAIHGGSWFGGVAIGDQAFALATTRTDWMATAHRDELDRYRALGWTVYNVDYHSGGARALDDLQAFYDELRAQMPAAKICTLGGSAGGHLALMLATRNHDIDCAVSLAGPTNLPALSGDAVALATAAFGPQAGSTAWDDNSPALQLAGFESETFLAGAANDQLVPPTQAQGFASALAAVPGAPPAQVEILASGGTGYGWACPPDTTNFIHACVTDAAYADYLAAEAAFLDGI